MKNYIGILVVGHNSEAGGRGIAGFRLRTAAKKAGFDVLLVDSCAKMTESDILSIIDKYKNTIKFVGFSITWVAVAGTDKSSYLWFNSGFFDAVKNLCPDVKIISGGHAVGMISTREFLPYVDYHFHGFSDNSFVEFLKYITGNQHNLKFSKKKLYKAPVIQGNTDYPVLPDDTETELEPIDGFLPHDPVPLEVSRGCIFRCAYCHHPFQGKSDYDSYIRSPESLARELKRNYELFGTTRYTITDDTFNDSIEKINRLQTAVNLSGIPKFEFIAYIRPDLIAVKPEMIDLLVNLGLKGAFFGVESLNQSARKAVGKGTHIDKILDVGHKLAARGVLIHAGMIVGLPTDTEETIIKAQEYLMSGKSPFRFWIWAGLFLKQDNYNFDDAKSLLDKEPGKYGYTFMKSEKIRETRWHSNDFTSATANELAARLNEQTFANMRYAGWRLAGAWQLNKTDEQIQNEVVSIYNFSRRVANVDRIRATLHLKYILENC